MTATPGQAAYEAIAALFGSRYEDFPVEYLAWDKLDDGAPEIYEAAAQAAIDVFLAGDSVSAESIREAIAAQEPHAAPGQWQLVVNATGDPVSEPLGEDEAKQQCADLNLKVGRDWYAARPVAAQQPQPAPELAAAMRESRLRAEVITEILGAFGPSGSGHTARVGMVQIAKWRTRAGLTS